MQKQIAREWQSIITLIQFIQQIEGNLSNFETSLQDIIYWYQQIIHPPGIKKFPYLGEPSSKNGIAFKFLLKIHESSYFFGVNNVIIQIKIHESLQDCNLILTFIISFK